MDLRKIYILMLFLVFYTGNAAIAETSDTLQVFAGNELYNAKEFSGNDSLKSILQFQSKINAILADKNLNGAQFGIAVYSITTGKSVYNKNGSALLTPASNTKLFTTFSVLDCFGGNFNTKTSVYCDKSKIDDGVLNDDLYLYGRGDINLGASDLEDLAEQIHKMGIKEIKGNICADESFFDKNYLRKDYSGDGEEVEKTNPIYPLTLNENNVTVIVKAVGGTGARPKVQVIPNAGNVIINNSARIGIVPAGDSNAINATVCNWKGKITVNVTGVITPRTNSYFAYPNGNPGYSVAGTLKDRLGIEGIKVTGRCFNKCFDRKNDDIEEIAHVGHPITDIIYRVNKRSDNFLAEMTFKIIGGNYGKYASTAQSAREKIQQCLKSHNIWHQGYQLNDGCGLSRRNKVSPDGIVTLLKTAKERNYGTKFDSTLAIAGVDGTLRKRMKGTYAENNLHAKTGTLRDVSALSGYVYTLSGEVFAFSFIFNGPSTGYYKLMENKLGAALAEFKYTHF